MMSAATHPVAVSFFLSVSPQCGQVAAFAETSRLHVLQLINFVTDLLYPPGTILPLYNRCCVPMSCQVLPNFHVGPCLTDRSWPA